MEHISKLLKIISRHLFPHGFLLLTQQFWVREYFESVALKIYCLCLNNKTLSTINKVFSELII